MTLSFRITAILMVTMGLSASSQTPESTWHLPEILGSGPAIFSVEAPSGYAPAASPNCVAQVVTYDLFCTQETWDALCQEAYECCRSEDDILNLGCTNANACNYDPTVCVDVPMSCVFCLEHCFSLQMMDDEGNGWEDVMWTLSDNQGQTVTSGTLSNGYNALAAGCLDDGCYLLEVEESGNDNVIHWVLNGSGMEEVSGGGGESVTFSLNAPQGCTIPGACNYNPEACLDDGTCTFEDNGITSMNAFPWEWTLGAGCAEDVLTAELSFYDDFSASGNDGTLYTWSLCGTTLTIGVDDVMSYEGTWDGLGFVGAGNSATSCFTLYPSAPGCTDASACNFNDEATVSDGSCTYPGCMNPLSCDFDPLAGCPAPCDLPPGYVEGCTNPLSSNFDALATVDDGTCDLSHMCLNGTVYDSVLMGCVPSCPGDMNFDGVINVIDLLEFLLVYDTTCP